MRNIESGDFLINTVERILKLIKDKGIQQKELANELGFKETNISDWKKGKSKSYTKYIYQIAEYLNTSVAYLLCEINYPTSNKKNSSEYEMNSEREKKVMKLNEIAESLTIENLEVLVKIAKSLNSEREE